MSESSPLVGNNVRYNAQKKTWEEILQNPDGSFCIIGSVQPIVERCANSLTVTFFGRNSSIEEPRRILTMTAPQFHAIKSKAEKEYESELAGAQMRKEEQASSASGAKKQERPGSLQISVPQNPVELHEGEDTASGSDASSPSQTLSSPESDSDEVRHITEGIRQLIIRPEEGSVRIDTLGKVEKSIPCPSAESKNFRLLWYYFKNIANFLLRQNRMAEEYSLSEAYKKERAYKYQEELSFTAYENFLKPPIAVEMTEDFYRWNAIVQLCCADANMKVWNATTGVYSSDDPIRQFILEKVSPEDEVMLQCLCDFLREIHESWETELGSLMEELQTISLFKDESGLFNDLGWTGSTYQSHCSCLPIRLARTIDVSLSNASTLENTDTKAIIKFALSVLTNQRKTLEATQMLPNITIPEGSSFWDFIQTLPIFEDQIATQMAKMFAKSVVAVTSYVQMLEDHDRPLVRIKKRDAWMEGVITSSLIEQTCCKSGIPDVEINGLLDAMKSFLEARHNSPVRLTSFNVFVKLYLKTLLDLDIITITAIHNLEPSIVSEFIKGVQIEDDLGLNFFRDSLASLVIREIERVWPIEYLAEQASLGYFAFYSLAGRDYFNFVMHPTVINDANTRAVFAVEMNGTLSTQVLGEDLHFYPLVDKKGSRFEPINMSLQTSLQAARNHFTSCVEDLRTSKRSENSKEKLKIKLCVIPSDSRNGIMLTCLTSNREAFPDYSMVHVVPDRFLNVYEDAVEIKCGSSISDVERRYQLAKELMLHRVSYLAFMLLGTRSDGKRIFDTISHFEWGIIFNQTRFHKFLSNYCSVGLSRVKISIKGIINSYVQRMSLKVFLEKSDRDFEKICKNLETLRVSQHLNIIALLKKEEILELIGLTQDEVEKNSHFFLHDLRDHQDRLEENMFFPLPKKKEFLELVLRNHRGVANDEMQEQLSSLRKNDARYLEYCQTYFERSKNLECRMWVGSTFEVAGASNKNSCYSNVINHVTLKFGFRHTNPSDMLFAISKVNGIVLPPDIKSHLEDETTVPSGKILLNLILREQLFASVLVNFLHHPGQRKMGLFIDEEISSVIMEQQPIVAFTTHHQQNWSRFLMHVAFLKLHYSMEDANPFLRTLVVSAREINMQNIKSIKRDNAAMKAVTDYNKLLLFQRGGNLSNMLTKFPIPTEVINNFTIAPYRAVLPFTIPPEHGGYPTHYEALKFKAGIDSSIKADTDKKRKRVSDSSLNSPNKSNAAVSSTSPGTSKPPGKKINLA